MTKLTINSTIPLPRSNANMPLFQLGVYQSSSAKVSVRNALEAGYRAIDSATIYRNEEEVGEAVFSWREDGGNDKIWLTSKITSKEYGTAKTRNAVNSSIDKLSTSKLEWDLYLLHDPTAGPAKRLEAWKVLENFVKAKKLRSIGVSNFVRRCFLPFPPSDRRDVSLIHYSFTSVNEPLIHGCYHDQSDIHLEEFKAASVSVPEVNQIELHPFCQQKPIVRDFNTQCIPSDGLS